MTLYILDTDHLSLYGRGYLRLQERISVTPQEQLSTTVINAEELLRGRLAQIAEVRSGLQELSGAYERFLETLALLSEFYIFNYDEQSRVIYQTLKVQRLRVGTQDLRIASITIANNGILITRNLRDFEKIPGLSVEDW